MAQKHPTHLPLLYNPLLNCLFNNPQHSKPPFKQTINDLAKNHNEFTIIVPPAHILEDGYDPDTATLSTKSYLRSLCYNNEDFIRSHIIRTSNPTFNGSQSSSRNQAIIYSTLSGKQVLLKNGMIFTGKGFKKSLRLSILGFDYFNSFCDYFPRGSKFMIMYIEDTLIGSNLPALIDYMIPQIRKSIDPPEIEPLKSSDNSTVTFEMLLRSLPLLSNAVSEHYLRLFHHNNDKYRVLRTQTRKTLETIKSEFHMIVEDAYKIMADSVKLGNPNGEKMFDLLSKVLEKNPGLDLNKLVYEYVELNLYDKVWSQLLFQFNYPNDDKQAYDPDAVKSLTAEKYNQLSCLSLSQLDITVDEPWFLNKTLKRVWSAMEEFTRLSDTSVVNASAKRTIITNTINILTGGPQQPDANSELGFVSEKEQQSADDDFLIDADTLLGMLIMVVVHSKVDNLEAHLYYLKNFSSVDLNGDGYMNYILSNLEAVILHLSSKEEYHLETLVDASQRNYELWSSIQRGQRDKVIAILEKVEEEYKDIELPPRHFLKSRNINGESCLMFATKSKEYTILSDLLLFNPQWFSIDEILFDRNTTTNQNLLMIALMNEEHSSCQLIIDIITNCATQEEQYAYFNQVDYLGRSIGHYLFHDLVIMQRIGQFIDWELQDNNSHTPLFSLCRCYDHNDYVRLIEVAFDCVYQKYGRNEIDFDKHIDNNGNTLLHVILKGLPESQMLQALASTLNVNQLNNKSMNPLTLYVKYNRASNVSALLKDKRLHFLYEEPNNLHNVFDYLGFAASKASPQNMDFRSIEKEIYGYFRYHYFPKIKLPVLIASNARFDSSTKDWILFFHQDEESREPIFHDSLEKLRQMTQLFDMQNPMIAFPGKEHVWLNCPKDIRVIPAFSKFRINRLIENLNVMFIAMSMYAEDLQKSFMSHFTVNENKTRAVFEVMKEINKKQDASKKRIGEVMLSQNQIVEVEMFLKYSIGDLRDIRTHFIRLNKLLSVAHIKQGDVRLAYDRMIAKFCGSDIIPGMSDTVKFEWVGEQVNNGIAYQELLKFTAWLESSLKKLIGNVEDLLRKLDTWNEIYDKIGTYNNEIKRYEHKAHPTQTSDDEASTQPGSHRNESSSLFSFGVENKKSRYRRLLMIKAEEVKRIMNLNSEIKLDHETIAAELSRYLKYSPAFLQFGLKRFVVTTITSLKSRLQQLQRLHYSCKIQYPHDKPNLPEASRALFSDLVQHVSEQ